MSLEENKAVIRRWFDDAYGQRNLSVVDEIVADDLIVHGSGADVTHSRPEDAKKHIKGFSAFTDIKITYDEPIAEGDRVAVRWVASGTKTDTKEHVSYTHIYIYRIINGKITEEWRCHMA